MYVRRCSSLPNFLVLKLDGQSLLYWVDDQVSRNLLRNDTLNKVLCGRQVDKLMRVYDVNSERITSTVNPTE